jgi:hypothetical protein
VRLLLGEMARHTSHRNNSGMLLPELLPNSGARGGTRTDSERHRPRKAVIGREVLGLVGIAEYGGDRICRPLRNHSATWPHKSNNCSNLPRISGLFRHLKVGIRPDFVMEASGLSRRKRGFLVMMGIEPERPYSFGFVEGWTPTMP